MQRVSSPRELPRPEVRLTTLLVKICKDEEQQDGNESGDDGRCDDNTIHRVGGKQLARVAGSLSGEISVVPSFHNSTSELNRI